jgi:outer membrane protein OmpA-like peptidoglycan-associated protein
MPCHGRHLILLYPLLLIPFLTRSQQRRPDTIILHFAFNSYRVRPADSARLYQTFFAAGADSVSITGYTDKTGTIAYNQRLSQQRADAAYRWVRRAANSAAETAAPHGQVIGGGIAPTPERSDSDNRRAEIVYYHILSDAANTVATPRSDTAAARRRSDTIAAPRPDAGAGRPNDSIVVVKSAPPDSSNTPDSAQPAAVLALHHINFIVDTPIPTDSTRSILPQFITELQQFKGRRLEIDGYVNSIVPLRGEKDPLYVLSVRRAKFIYDYLVDAGFDPDKLSYKGMGNASPINPTPVTRQEMNANMRVEIKVY